VSATLWNDIDAYLAAAVIADMGTDSPLYDGLWVEQVVTGAAWEPQHWRQPAVAINGEQARLEGGPHGDGVVHLEITYPYALVGVCKAATIAQARKDAKELGRRLRELIRSRYALGGLVASDGERVQRTDPPIITIYCFPVDGSTRQWYGVAQVDLDVHSTL
jgi:hypothetical protein